MHVPNVEAPTAEEQQLYPAYPVPLRTGNNADDDATVLDEMLKENPEPGLPFPTSPGELKPPSIKPATRLITGSITLLQRVSPAANTPYRILAADPRRIDLRLYLSVVTQSVEYAPVLLASDGGAFLTATAATQLNAADAPTIHLECHNGEVWAHYPSDVATDVVVSWVATTI